MLDANDLQSALAALWRLVFKFSRPRCLSWPANVCIVNGAAAKLARAAVSYARISSIRADTRGGPRNILVRPLMVEWLSRGLNEIAASQIAGGLGREPHGSRVKPRRKEASPKRSLTGTKLHRREASSRATSASGKAIYFRPPAHKSAAAGPRDAIKAPTVAPGELLAGLFRRPITRRPRPLGPGRRLYDARRTGGCATGCEPVARLNLGREIDLAGGGGGCCSWLGELIDRFVAQQQAHPRAIPATGKLASQQMASATQK